MEKIKVNHSLPWVQCPKHGTKMELWECAQCEHSQGVNSERVECFYDVEGEREEVGVNG